MANLINTVDWLTMESLRTLQNKLEVASRFNTDENKYFTQKFPVGETIRIKLPQRWVPQDGIAYQPQAITRKFTTATLNNFVQIGFDWDSVEQALKLERSKEEIFKEYFETAVEQIAQEIDSRAASFAMLNTNHVTGTIGTQITSTAPFAAARQKLLENAGLAGELVYIVAPKVNAGLASSSGILSLFNPTDEISRLFKKGYLGYAAGGQWYENMSLYSFTAGTWGTAANINVNGANQSGSTLTINDNANDTFNPGDIFTIAKVYEVNPVTRRSTGQLKQFVVTLPLVGTAGGTDVLTFSPPIIGPDAGGALDQYQNTDSLPATGALLSLFGGSGGGSGSTLSGQSGVQNLAFTRDAFALVSVELELPKAVEFASQKRDPKTGIALRITRTWDALLSRFINRIDTLFGFGNLYPDNCSTRIATN